MSKDTGHVNFYFSKLLREAIWKKYEKEGGESNCSYAAFIRKLIIKGLKK